MTPTTWISLPIAASTVTWIDVVTFVLYIVATLAFGLWVGGRQGSLKTYLLAGHQMHWSLVAISVLAALFSGISFLGAPAESFSHNLIYVWMMVSFFIATPITTLIFLPFFFRMNGYTAYEYLEHRFDLRLRRISSAAFIFRVCLWLALALYAPALAISELMGVPLWVPVVLAGLGTTLYTTVGGMRAVIYTDVAQFTVLVVGITVIFVMALREIPGGAAAAWQIASEGGRTRMFDFSLSPEVRMTFWGALLGGAALNLVQLVTDQVSVQRYLTATNLRESQRALWFKLFLTLPLVLLFYSTGLVLYSFYQTHPALAATLTSPDRLLPHFVGSQIPSPIPGLLVAAILSATMSVVSSGINSLTTATLMDFIYVKKGHEGGSKQEELTRVRVARGWTIFYGIAVTLLGLVVSKLGTLVESTVKIGGFLGGPLLGIFFLGVLSRRVNAPGTLIGAIAGFAAVFCIGLFTSASFMWYALIGCLVTVAAGKAASTLFPPPSERQKSFTFKWREENP